MHSLPDLLDSGTFRTWRANPSNWLPAALNIARSHRLPHADPMPFPAGTNLVVALDARLAPMLLHRAGDPGCHGTDLAGVTGAGA